MKTFENMSLTVVRQTEHPNHLIKLATDLTQKKKPSGLPASLELVSYLYRAGHTSIFEHASMSILIEGVSRAFLAQITRHRMASYTAGSQHYQEYSQYDDVVPAKLATHRDISDTLIVINYFYDKLISQGYKPEEARYILPNSKLVNILWTINARSLCNFLVLRLCRRNVDEMYIFAQRLKSLCLGWWPELFKNVGPECIRYGFCNQGPMQAESCQGVIPIWKKETNKL